MNDKMKKYHRDWYHTNKDRLSVDKRNRAAKNRRFFKSIVDQIKLICGCKVCGYDKHPSALSFHHRDAGMKNFDISTGKNGIGVLKLISEIEKCDVLCMNCHMIHHAQRNIRVVA